ncbi:unnamed protein product [Bathycoccus prasinos]
MDHPPPPESVVDPMMRDLFGKNHEVSNDCAIKIQKLEARLTSGKRRVLSPGDSKMMLNATTTTGGGTPIDVAKTKADDLDDDDAAKLENEKEKAEREVLEDSDEDDYSSSQSDALKEDQENSRESQRENRAPKTSTTSSRKKTKKNKKQEDENNNKNDEDAVVVLSSSVSAGKKRKKGSSGFATVAAARNTTNGLSHDGGMIAQLESATGVSGRVVGGHHRVVGGSGGVVAAAATSPGFDHHQHQHQQGGGVNRIFVGSGDGGKSRDGSDVPKEVFQPPLQRELFGSVGVSPSSSSAMQRQLQLQQQEKIKLFEEKILALQQQVEEVTREREDAERQAEAIATKLHSDEKQVEIRRRRARNAFAQLGKLERAEARRKLRDRSQRLGSVAVRRVGTQLNEVWEDGEAFAQLEERMKKIAEQKKDAEERRRAIKRKLPPPGASAETGSNINNNNTKDATADRNSMNNNNNNNNNTKQISDVHREFALSEEVHKTRVNQLRREEEAISREREVLEREKLALAREIKRTRDEDDSRFNDFPMLGGQEPGCERYAEEASRKSIAPGIVKMKEVACKLHSLNPRWSEERKRAYVRHAARECSIHKSLKHDHVVKLLDVFEVDSDTFCTVLELCEGDDLDARLKNTGSMSEREARAIVAQIFAGLAYCHGDTKRVIHYDLKPGNILFDNSGRVKITDFGLSKVMESRENIGSNNDFTSVELTSQGAGTYWYLPPECFETGPAPPKISSKVDVWSVGVIFYQMVYGKRPFGHEQTQEQILQAGTIRDAKKVEFPQKPALSNEAKEFICNCLSYRQSERPDVLQAALDPYVQFGGATNNGGGK